MLKHHVVRNRVYSLSSPDPIPYRIWCVWHRDADSQRIVRWNVLAATSFEVDPRHPYLLPHISYNDFGYTEAHHVNIEVRSLHAAIIIADRLRIPR